MPLKLTPMGADPSGSLANDLDTLNERKRQRAVPKQIIGRAT